MLYIYRIAAWYIMSDSGATETSTEGLTNTPEGSSHYGSCHLLDLPTEMILRICDFLDSETVIKVLGSVCQFLALLVTDDLIWRSRIHKRWPNKRYPPVSGGLSLPTIMLSGYIKCLFLLVVP